jgi:hypothetical protein
VLKSAQMFVELNICGHGDSLNAEFFPLWKFVPTYFENIYKKN